MGYTHYWNFDEYGEEDKDGYKKALPIVRKIVKKYNKILRAEYDSDEKPEVSKDAIVFNGIGDDGHETFYFSLADKDSGFTFCKTARKPYDIAVCEVLLVLNYFCPGLGIDSDGFSGYLESPELDGTWSEAIENVKEYGVEYLVLVTNERHPYCDMRPMVKKSLQEA